MAWAGRAWLTRRKLLFGSLLLYVLLRVRLAARASARGAAAAAAAAPVLYSAFLQKVQNGEVAKVLLAPDSVSFMTRSKFVGGSAKAFVTDRFSDETLLPLLMRNKVAFGAAPKAVSKRIGPYLVLAVPFVYLALAAYMMLGVGKGGPKGKPMGKRQDRMRDNKSTVHFADAGGVDSAKAELLDIVSFIRNPKKYLLQLTGC